MFLKSCFRQTLSIAVELRQDVKVNKGYAFLLQAVVESKSKLGHDFLERVVSNAHL